MFRSFIYLDEDKMYTYIRQINGKHSAQPKSMTQRQSTGLSAGTKIVGVNASFETNINGEFIKDVSFDYDHFELDLAQLDGEDYFDCVLNPDYDLSTVPAMKIVRICSGFKIPEAFDVVNLIEQFKPMLMGQIEITSAGEQEALETIMGKASADIPFIIELDEVTISGKLNAKHLKEDCSSLEDYSDQDVYLLCKVVGLVQKENVEIFDPLKGFIRLPRTMRRQMTNRNSSIGLEKISVEGPVLKVEAIAIYK